VIREVLKRELEEGFRNKDLVQKGKIPRPILGGSLKTLNRDV